MKVKNNSMKINKMLDIEVMRIVAAFFVIFNHSEYFGHRLFSQFNKDSLNFFIYLMPSFFCRFSVYLFLAISGILLLRKEVISYKELFTKRIYRILLILFIWSFIYYLLKPEILSGGGIKFDQFILSFLQRQEYMHLWYIYRYIGFLISLPLLYIFTKNINKKQFLYMITLVLIIYNIIPAIQYIFWDNKFMIYALIYPDWIIVDIFLYPCLGYLLYYKFNDFWTINRIIILWIINFITMLIKYYMLKIFISRVGGFEYNNHEVFHNMFIIIHFISILVTIQYVFAHIKLPKLLEKFILSLGSCTLGIYLLHAMFVYRFKILEQLCNYLTMYFGPMTSCFIACIIIFFTCYIITLVLKKIPFIGKYIV